MFYAASILSLANKTEISLLYYVATMTKYKRISKKEIISFNIPRAICLIEATETPFSLRLHAHLLKGLARAWITKADHCSQLVKIACNATHPERHPRKSAESASLRPPMISPNLAVCEEYIEDTSTGLSGIGDSMGSVEWPRRGSSSLMEPVDPIGIAPAPDKRKSLRPSRTIEDTVTTLSPGVVWAPSTKRLRVPHDGIAIPDGIGQCTATAWLTMDRQPSPATPSDVHSSSLDMFLASHEDWQPVPEQPAAPVVHAPVADLSADCPERARAAAWFYGLLVRAAAGSVHPLQAVPYGPIEYQHVNK